MKLTLTANEIDAWAREEPRRAQEILPGLIVRLILATSKKITDYKFPIEKGIQFSGYDGILISEEQTAYFPKGKSVWEFGTNTDLVGKFKSDIEKRSNDSLGFDTASTVFVFATLKIWSHKTSMQCFNSWATTEDAPVFQVLSVCQIVSVQDLWNLLFDQLTEGDIEKFLQCIEDVFGIIDPKFELPEKQWTFAPLFGAEARYSEMLRQGLVISLIMLFEQEGMENNCNVVSTKQFVDGIVRNVLKPVVTWQHWNTIAPVLTLLAEASPEEVLEKVEHEIADDNGELWKLFSPSEDLPFGKSHYTHILWTLECLVWYRRYAVRSIMLLAKINERKIKYTLANSPINTLYEIFCLWHPQNSLEMNEQRDVLQRIFAVYPETGWELADKLLPSGSETCGEIQKPRWRSFDGEVPKNPTGKELQEGIQAITAVCVKYAATAKEWKIVIRHITLFGNHYDELAEKMETYSKTCSVEDALQIADALREKISKFRRFPDANWSWGEENVQRLENLWQKVTPSGVEQFYYLFRNNPHLLHPIPYHERKSYSYQEEQGKIRNERAKAAETILTKFGAEELVDFSINAEDAGDLGQILAEKVFKNSYNFELLSRIRIENYILYTSIVRSLLVANGLENMRCALENNEQLTDEEKGDILCHTSLSPEVWETVDGMPAATVKYYWEHIDVFRLDSKYSNYQDHFLDQLLRYKRPFSAVRLIAYTEYCNTNQIMRILRECATLKEHSEKNGLTIRSVTQYEIVDLFEKLYADKSVDLEKLVELEIIFFNI